MDEVDPELIKTFNKLGIPLEEQMAFSGMAVDAVMDFGVRKDYLQGDADGERHHLLFVQRAVYASIPIWYRNIWDRW